MSSFNMDDIDIFEDEISEKDESDSFLVHYGTKFHSGRYPYGSGENPYQHEPDFRKTRDEMRKKGMSDNEIAKGMGMSTTEYRAMVSISKEAIMAERRAKVIELKAKGYSNVKAAELLGISEGSVRNILDEDASAKEDILKNVSNELKRKVDSNNGFIDIGDGSERYLNISRTKLDAAAKRLELEEGYEVLSVQVPQVTNTGKYTTVKVLAPPGTTYMDVKNHIEKIGGIDNFEVESTKTALDIHPPQNLDSKRIMIRYADDPNLSGKDRDGVIELRRGVDDLSLGNSNYAQVRIAVDGTHYLKGMAVYSDNLPKGVDVIFNTNKSSDVPPEKVFKKLKDDPDNPFGATITAQNGVINKVKEEGEWAEYSKTLSSQFLSKQNMPLIKRQLNLSYSEKADEFASIMSLENEAVKKKLLESFADDCDASAVHLKAAALPRQATQVILPVTSMSEREVYAPNYNDGEEVVLIRYPHAGVFEIPRLKVNNKNAEAASMIGKNAKDAVGINSKVAEQLSGADFDGDTVMVIPVNNKVKIRTAPYLDDLKGFDPKEAYPGYDGMKVISPSYKQKQMGVVSNLITDMTIQGASEADIAKAVKHSMVVIDAEKHALNYKLSEKENDIAYLKQKYQDGGGAATLISKAKSEKRVDERKIFNIKRDTNKETGEKEYTLTNRVYMKDGKEVHAQIKSTKMAEATDAYSLVSKYNTQQEIAYADYANKLKALGNEARKAYLSAGSIERIPSAAKTYADEVNSLKDKLDSALKNAPRERQAQIVANTVVKAKLESNPDIKKDEEKRLKQQALAAARTRYGAKRKEVQVSITDREWEAIQAGAVSNNLLMKVLDNTDMDAVRQRATPRPTNTLSAAKEARIRSMKASGSTNAEIAEALGVSTSTVSKVS